MTKITITEYNIDTNGEIKQEFLDGLDNKNNVTEIVCFENEENEDTFRNNTLKKLPLFENFPNFVTSLINESYNFKSYY